MSGLESNMHNNNPNMFSVISLFIVCHTIITMNNAKGVKF